MTELIKKYYGIVFVVAFLICLYFLIFKPRTETVTIVQTRIDTVKTIGLNEIIKRDTVVRWYEITKEIKVPTNIYIEKIDSVEVVKYREYDLMVSVEKKANKDLFIRVLNQEHKVLKEYVYHDVGDVFNVTSQENNINVKSTALEWKSIGAYIEHSSSLKWSEHNFEGGITTGISWLDKVDVDVRAGYDVNLKDFRLKEQLTLYPFR